jgi:hypothetical protein
MGTSSSHPSPSTTSWKPLKTCYTNPKINPDVVINNLWRAASHSDSDISNQMKSIAVTQCLKAVSTSTSAAEAIAKANESIISSGTNSIIAELGKRAIMVSFESDNPKQQWVQAFFSEVTKYIVSRDISGFVGKNYRNRTVKEMIEFKRTLALNVSQTVRQIGDPPNKSTNWTSYIERIIEKLKSK